MERFLIGGNLKMNKTQSEFSTYLSEFFEKIYTSVSDYPVENRYKKNVYFVDNLEIILFPSFTNLPYANQKFDKTPGSPIFYGAQTVSSKDSGAYTGEISAGMLADLGCSNVLIAHSEQRAKGLSHDEINLSLKQAIKYGIRPMLCIGEKLEEREKAKEVLKEQVVSVLQGIDIEKIDIAYEPVWAIGTGLTPSIEDVADIMRFLKGEFGNERTAFLYGGSVNEGNFEGFMDGSLGYGRVDGFLIGGACLDSQKFFDLIIKINEKLN